MVSTAGSPRLHSANLLAFLLISPVETVRVADLVAAGFTGDLTPLVRSMEEQGLLVITVLDCKMCFHLPREIVLLAELLKHPSGFTYSCTSPDFKTDFQALDTLRRKRLATGIMDRRYGSLRCQLSDREQMQGNVWYIAVTAALELVQAPVNAGTGSDSNRNTESGIRSRVINNGNEKLPVTVSASSRSRTRKKVVGYWLSTWQVHWFHGKIIKYVKAIANRKGIRVELVVARNTSQRCSVCGRLGKRKGKKFTCEHCKSKNDPSKNRQLDSDLNASRNITIAPVSLNFLRASGKGGGPTSRAQQINTAGLTITG
ncbi:MAG: zinc ribbon domain-containing protein [Candidatus Odinarchaeota archaeon]